jgi:NADPH:quinone reductase-like Zn-dependent oxidoreductase
MKAIVRHRYGSPDALSLEDVEVPAVGDDQVLVRVRAASVNAYDWHVLRGLPYLVRMEEGLLEPKTSALGVDLAGEIEAVGKAVTEFQPGDAVYGERDGAFAEYVSGRAVNFAPKPANLTFEQAAAVPMAGYTALQALRDKGQVQAGDKVLVNGASGGVGSFAVQIARALGAEVTGVCSTRNLDLVRSIGADHVIDYSHEDFTRGVERYDLIIDVAATRPLRDCRRVLTSTGKLVIVGAAVGHADGRWIGPMIRPAVGMIVSRLVKERPLLPFLAHRSKDDLIVLTGMIETGSVTPVIDRAYPLAESAEAIRFVEAGHARGKVVITI